jgi:hypothetical protein
MEPTTVFSNGGLDANWLVKHGLPTVTFGAGQFEVHTVKEYVNLAEFADGCRVAVAVATLAEERVAGKRACERDALEGAFVGNVVHPHTRACDAFRTVGKSSLEESL